MKSFVCLLKMQVHCQRKGNKFRVNRKKINSGYDSFSQSELFLLRIPCFPLPEAAVRGNSTCCLTSDFLCRHCAFFYWHEYNESEATSCVCTVWLWKQASWERQDNFYFLCCFISLISLHGEKGWGPAYLLDTSPDSLPPGPQECPPHTLSFTKMPPSHLRQLHHHLPPLHQLNSFLLALHRLDLARSPYASASYSQKV